MTDHDFHVPPIPPPPHPTPTASRISPFRTRGQTRMRLTITSGMSDARVRVDPDATDLIAIAAAKGSRPGSGSRPPSSGCRGRHLRVVAARRAGGRVPRHRAGAPPCRRLDAADPGGLSRFEADLAAGQLARLEISGGVSEADSTCRRHGPWCRCVCRAARASSGCAVRPTRASASRCAAASRGCGSMTSGSRRLAAVRSSRPESSPQTRHATPSRSAAAPAASWSRAAEPAARETRAP